MVLGRAELVDVWEDGQELSSLERSMLTVLTWDTVDDVTAVTIDELNGRVLRLRSRLFGKDVEFYAQCEECGEEVEFTLDTSQLEASQGSGPGNPLLIDGREMVCRPPAAAEVIAALRAPDPRRWLAECCLQPMDDRSNKVPKLSDADVDGIEDRLRAGHPLLEVILEISCPTCEHKWDQLLDIDSLLWRDIDREARRLLDDVDRLARSYGWSEADILAMGPQRRARYLELSG